jgi:hypothetical protein
MPRNARFGLKALFIWTTALAISLGLTFVAWNGESDFAWLFVPPVLLATLAAPVGYLVDGSQGLRTAALAGAGVGVVLVVGALIFVGWVFSQMP